MKRKQYIYDFQQYGTIKSFSENIYTDENNIDEAEMDQRICLKIQQNLVIDLDQERQTVNIKGYNFEGLKV